MSLRVRKLANRMTSAVNENVTATVKISTGYTVSPSGKQEQSYVSVNRSLQLQSMESDELEHFGFSSQQGVFKSVYMDGMIDIIDRMDQKGTSLVETQRYGDSRISTWQVMKIAESYNDWVRFIIRQTGVKDA